MQNARFGNDDKFLRIVVLDILQQASRTCNEIGDNDNRLFALGMSNNLCSGMLLLEFQYCLEVETAMHMAGSIPQHHIPAGLRVDVTAKILVGTEDYLLVGRQTIDNLLCVGGSHCNVGHRLYGCRGVDVRNNSMSRMFGNKLGELVGRTRIGKRATSIEVGNYNFLVGADDFCRLTHKVNAKEHNYFGIGLGCHLSQLEAVAYIVADVLQFGIYVEMPKNYGILFLFHAENLRFQVDIAVDWLVYKAKFLYIFLCCHLKIDLSVVLCFRMRCRRLQYRLPLRIFDL